MQNQRVLPRAALKRFVKSAGVRRRIAASHLGIILPGFVLDLHSLGYTSEVVQRCRRTAEHFGWWAKRRGLALGQLSERCVRQFLHHHLRRCHCPRPASKSVENCGPPLNRLLDFLRERDLIRPPEQKPVASRAVDRLMVAYDQHMDQVGGLAASTRRMRQYYARQLLKWRYGRRPVRLRQLVSKDMAEFVKARASEMVPESVHALAVGLRGFLRFLEFSERIRRRLSAAVPHPAPSPSPQPPKVLEWNEWRRFLNHFPRATPVGRRDYAIALCLSQLALRSHEVAALTLDDLNWRAGTLRLAQTKQRRERRLPMPDRLARALASYLKHGRPQTQSRRLFVRHHAPVGQPLSARLVQSLMRRAFARSGIKATGTHILRHTWATWAHRRGASLKLIADVLGHRSLNTTTRYAHVNLEQLRQAALPWPKAKP